MRINRRRFLFNSAIASGAFGIAPHLAIANGDQAAPFRTPYKYPKLVLSATGSKGDFDQRSPSTIPSSSTPTGAFQMLYIGWDGIGYQTGLATSTDLVHWTRTALVAPTRPILEVHKIQPRPQFHPSRQATPFRGEAIKVDGKYVGAWNAYPSAGYEEGAAVIGLATSDDLLHWQLTDPILPPQDGAPWEHGGLYRPDLMLDRGTYYLYYNAKTDVFPKTEGGGWHEQTGVATSTDLKTWTRYRVIPSSATVRAAAQPIPATNPISSTQPPTPDARDSRFASNPFVVQNGRDYRHVLLTAFATSARAAPARCSPSASIPSPSSKSPRSSSTQERPGTIDETFAHKPSVITHEGVLYHFYCAVSGKYPNESRGIAVARSKPW